MESAYFTTNSDTCDIVVGSSREIPVTNDSNLPVVLSPKRMKDKNNGKSPLLGRIIDKDGTDNILRTNIPNRFRQFARDLANSLIHRGWKWMACTILLCYSISWLVFAFLWYLVSKNDVHDDNFSFNTHQTISAQTSVSENTGNCVVTSGTILGYILLSIETQTTIGFGTQYPTEFCVESWVVLGLQVLIGVGIEGALVSIVYSKMASPGGQNIRDMFSRKAVFYIRDGILSLVFRLHDKKGRHSIFTSVQAYLVTPTTEGELTTYHLRELQLENFGFLLWPVEIVHKVTPSSPLWDVSARDLINKRFEVIIQLKGDSITTGESSQARMSYLSSEILWGHRFVACVHFDPEAERYKINSDLFDSTEDVDIPLYSAKRYHQTLLEEQEDMQTARHCQTSTPLFQAMNTGSGDENCPETDDDDRKQVLISKRLLRKLFNGSFRNLPYVDDVEEV